YLGVIRELKSVLKTIDLESYSVFEVKGKTNHFEEIYTYSSEQAYEEADDSDNERINILINKISDMAVGNTTKYTTLYELSEN
ncbi:MAG: hypothetical protein WB779_07790, partial [Ignavibacteriaceae bacterium]